MEEWIQRWLYDPVLGRLVAVIVAFMVVFALVRLIQRGVGRRVQDVNTRYRARKLVAFMGYLAAAFVLVTVFSSQLGSVQIVLGVTGAGIAFALQEVIISIAGWFAITFSNFFKTGDRIRMGGVNGDVVDIGILRTTLMEIGDWVDGDLYNGRVVRMANSFIFKDPVYNYSGDFPFLWDEIKIPIKYGSDHRLARKLLEQVAADLLGEYAENARKAWGKIVQKFLIEDAQVVPLISLTADENWMTFTVRYVVDFKKRRTTKDALFARILDDIEKTDGKVMIAPASMDITLVQPDK